jgi:4-amino-4-deoxy-L-arabinose transferase-like glycosyltransferase
MQQHKVWRDCLLLFLVLGIFYFVLLGWHPFLTPDEGRYVEIPREMLFSGEYIVPHLNGVPYFEKPPLFYWMQTFSLSTLGSSTWAMRAWVALMGVLSCLSSYWLTQKIWDRRTGVLTALIQSTAFLCTINIFYNPMSA